MVRRELNVNFPPRRNMPHTVSARDYSADGDHVDVNVSRSFGGRIKRLFIKVSYIFYL